MKTKMQATTTLPNFTASEVEGLTDEMKLLLQAVRTAAGVPIMITSGLRPGDTKSEHSLGMGVDISDNLKGEPITSPWRLKVVKAAILSGCRRIGVYDRHIHIGCSQSHPQDVMWQGVSE